MISAVFLDLDNTLLANDINRFLKAYLGALAEHMASAADPAELVRSLMAGTQAMLSNEVPERPLQEVFDEVFYPALRLDRDRVRAQIEDFYARRFPELRPLTHPVEAAVDLVRYAFERKWRVAVVTNPLFPRTAVLQRLEWAGLRPDEIPFDLITSYETAHFAKPHPEYFAEALALLVCQPEEVLLVGDDLELDIRPAQRLGLRTYWAGDETRRSGDGRLVGGPLSALLAGLRSNEQLCGQINAPDPTVLPLALRGNLAAILASFGRVENWNPATVAQGWGPTEIACHLRDVEREIVHPRVASLVQNHNPFLPAVESDLWAEERNYRGQEGREALRDFHAARKQTITDLLPLPPQVWQRPGRHAIFGPTTLAEQTAFFSRHDLMHIEQLFAFLAAGGHGILPAPRRN